MFGHCPQLDGNYGACEQRRNIRSPGDWLCVRAAETSEQIYVRMSHRLTVLGKSMLYGTEYAVERFVIGVHRFSACEIVCGVQGGMDTTLTLAVAAILATASVSAIQWTSLPCPRDNFTAEGCSWSNPSAKDVAVSLFFQVR